MFHLLIYTLSMQASVPYSVALAASYLPSECYNIYPCCYILIQFWEHIRAHTCTSWVQVFVLVVLPFL